LSDRRDVALAFAVAACAFGVYVATLPPSFGVWDNAEMQTVTAILGIAHPPGCPAMVLIGYAFVHAFPFGEPAWRLDVMCSLAVAASAALLYVVGRRFGLGRVTAAVCALGFAFALVPWHNATHAEIQDLALLFRVGALYFALRWYDRGDPRDLFAMALAAGLAVATHGIALLLLPVLALLVVARPGWKRPAPAGLIVAGFAAGLLPYVYLPFRSAYVDAHHLDPTVALGLAPGLAFWDYDDPSTFGNFIHFVTGADFHVAGGFAGFVDPLRYPHYVARLGEQIAHAYGWLGTLLSLGGGYMLIASRKLDGIALVLAALLPVPYTESYSDLQESERYYMLAFWCVAIAAGLGFERLAQLFELRANTVGRYAATAALALSFATAAPERAQIVDQRHDTFGPDFTAQVRTFTEDDAILLVAWGYATPLAYASYVDDSLGHRTVIPAGATQYLSYLPGWVARRPVYVIGFDSDLQLPGWKVSRVAVNSYYAYRLTK
jgi:hypothetical protein